MPSNMTPDVDPIHITIQINGWFVGHFLLLSCWKMSNLVINVALYTPIGN